jgi:hypothetical protein
MKTIGSVVSPWVKKPAFTKMKWWPRTVRRVICLCLLILKWISGNLGNWGEQWGRPKKGGIHGMADHGKMIGVSDHFVEVNKLIEIGGSGQREIGDLGLSYLANVNPTRFFKMIHSILRHYPATSIIPTTPSTKPLGSASHDLSQAPNGRFPVFLHGHPRTASTPPTTLGIVHAPSGGDADISAGP